MRSINQLALIGVLSLHGFQTLAAETITNFMSPVVSYQYPSNLGNEMLANGGVQSPMVSFQFSEDFASAALTNGGIMSALASYQYFEWPGNAILNLQNSPTVSYFWQSGISSTPAYLHGWVTDAKGAALSGATVSANSFSRRRRRQLLTTRVIIKCRRSMQAFTFCGRQRRVIKPPSAL